VSTATTAAARFRALATTAEVLVTDAAALPHAERVVRDHLRALDEACSRFRPDSELSRLHDRAGSAVTVGAMLFEALQVALRAAELTDGLVDPTVGRAVRALGYDQDFELLALDGPRPAVPEGPAPGWWRVRLDAEHRRVVLPRGVLLDLGATGKAWAADQAAARATAATGCGTLVALGGDVAVAGQPPEGGWRITVADGVTVSIRSGGVATSGTDRRTWRRAGRQVHHIADPRTGDVPPAMWRTVTVAAGSCVDANTASTAAIVLGTRAPDWLTQRRLPARLVSEAGVVTLLAGWPAETPAADRP
jgi:FAD:protein FMN transferase